MEYLLQTHPRLRVALLFLVFLTTGPSLSAMLHLVIVFNLENAAWSSSHIVFAKEAGQRAQFEVLSSWKGNLAKGSIIEVPAMLQVQSDRINLLEDKNINPQWPQPALTVLLFLQESSDPHMGQPRWLPATAEIKNSMIWFLNSQSLCFQPYGEELEELSEKPQNCRTSLFQLLTTVRQVMTDRASFDLLAGLPDKRARAEALATFLSSPYRAAHSDVFKQLQSCGPDAVPTLLAILRDPALLDKHREALRIFVDIKGPQAGPQLTDLLESEREFWAAAGTALQSSSVKPSSLLYGQDSYVFRRYKHTVDLLHTLSEIQFAGARETVTALRDTLAPILQLRSPDGTNPILWECNRVLSQLPTD
jgi:hypothetical protein